jgi:hypothetical protein
VIGGNLASATKRSTRTAHIGEFTIASGFINNADGHSRIDNRSRDQKLTVSLAGLHPLVLRKFVVPEAALDLQQNVATCAFIAIKRLV